MRRITESISLAFAIAQVLDRCGEDFGHLPRCRRPQFPAILALRDKPKILSRHDAEIIGDSIAEKCPFFREGRSDEGEDSLPELAEGRVVTVVGHEMVHHPPASLDGFEW